MLKFGQVPHTRNPIFHIYCCTSHQNNPILKINVHNLPHAVESSHGPNYHNRYPGTKYTFVLDEFDFRSRIQAVARVLFPFKVVQNGTIRKRRKATSHSCYKGYPGLGVVDGYICCSATAQYGYHPPHIWRRRGHGFEYHFVRFYFRNKRLRVRGSLNI